MGMLDEIDAEITQAFATDLADAVSQFTGVRLTTGKNDFITNKPTKVETRYTGQGVFGGYKEIEIDGEAIQANDVKMICLQSQCEGKPQLDDKINGYQVIAVQHDPVKATWTVQLRK